MPATQVSPAIRRRISDDARMLLRAALSDGCEDFNHDPIEVNSTGAHTCSISHLPLTERLQNFRGQLRLELLQPEDAEADTAVSLRIIVTSSKYLLRYQVASTGAEVSVLSQAGLVTSWITCHIQLGRFLASTTRASDDWQEMTMREMEASKAEILALLGVLDSLDLLDMVRALGGTSSGIYFGTERIYHASGEKNTYVFTFDARTGHPLSITQALTEDARAGDSDARTSLQLSIDDYVRHDDSSIKAPIGIKSDAELLVDAAVACFYEWTAAGRQQVEQFFALLDKDDDGSVSGQDVADQLLDAGHSSERAESIAAEMTRLLCDSDDPSEEVTFLPFVGFWIMLLADDVHVSDPSNEHRVLPGLQQLFLT
ncbi:hypothetical protein PR003_g2842 [Phytophthora rubi]|uniref:EF-hand domain-containing protein n=2 Tax=Phytophthora rubi TaxID=129364 RepID=A0A6A4G596_9STRA|nr:hypothetical protein PR002_g2674 [Phytophthora rubi]KAE9355470.1 hypothetical protein PR003_g2842 [Phytophthora rubi]